MITKLTKKQEQYIDVHYQNWIDKILKSPEKSEAEIEAGINWLYEICGMPKPDLILVMDNPLDSQLAANFLGDDNIRDKIYANINDKNLTYFSSSCNEGSWMQWYAYLDYYQQTGLCNDIDWTDFNRYCDVSLAYFNAIYFSSVVIVNRKPKAIRLDNQDKFHSLTEPAVSFKDLDFHALNGRIFEKDLWEKIVTKKLTFEETIKMKDIEERMIVLRYMSAQELLDGAKAEKVNGKTERGNELWKISAGAIFGQDEYFLRYWCHSSGREYLKAVSPAKVKDLGLNADALQAATHHFTLDEYLNENFVSV